MTQMKSVGFAAIVIMLTVLLVPATADPAYPPSSRVTASLPTLAAQPSFGVPFEAEAGTPPTGNGDTLVFDF